MANERLKNKNRIWELDFVRGLCVLLMIFDHTMYDIADIFGYEWWQSAIDAGKSSAKFLGDLWQVAHDYYFGSTQSIWGVMSTGSPIRAFVEPMVVVIFALCCGISCSFSRSNLKRGIELAILSGLITLVTYLLGEPNISLGRFIPMNVAYIIGGSVAGLLLIGYMYLLLKRNVFASKKKEAE